MKKHTSVSLSEYRTKQLDALAKVLNLSKSAVMESAIAALWENYVRDARVINEINGNNQDDNGQKKDDCQHKAA